MSTSSTAALGPRLPIPPRATHAEPPDLQPNSHNHAPSKEGGACGRRTPSGALYGNGDPT
ncbi:hypothetical protein PABG_12351 [Paracoccidioides brasiliensis Pb03]|nr:hypothetical protein PABG_12351 [Paracoccidioides brasiliensis Pb03]